MGIGLFFVGVQAGPPIGGVLLIGALLLLVLGLAAAAGYQLAARRGRPEGKFRGPSPLLLFALQVAAVNLASLVLLPLRLPGPEAGEGFLIAAVVLLTGYIGVVWLFAVRPGALSWRQMGLPERITVGRVFEDVMVATSTMLLVAFVAALGGGLLAQLLGTEAPAVVTIPTNSLELALVTLGAGLLVPIGEEVFFRGYTITAWLRDRGPRFALIWSSVFFAAVHVLNITVEPGDALAGAKQALLVVAVIGPVGFALGFLFLRRGLIAAIVGHATFNLFAILITVAARSLPTPG